MYEDRPSPYIPELPGLPELPEIIDARTNGLRLHASSAKALPPMANVGSMTNIREIEAAELARDIGIAFDISKQQQARSKAIARIKNRRMEQAAKNFGVR